MNKMSEYCSRCGAELEDDSKFCSECGEKVSLSEEEKNSLEKKIEDITPTTKKMGKGTKMVLIILIVLACISAALMASVLLDFDFGSNINDYFENGDASGKSIDALEEEFETAAKSIANDFTDEEGTYNFETSKAEENYILNYNSEDFEQHRIQLYEHDDICDFDSEYKEARDHIIEGLEHLVNKEYEQTYHSFLLADDAILMTNYMGDWWTKQFGFEDGACDILWDMGYRP